MTYAILQISAAAYADIRGRLVALDEKLAPTPSYASEYIMSGMFDAPERLIFGSLVFEALPPEPAVREPVAWRVKDFADGWILCSTKEEAEREAASAGNLIEPLYADEPQPSRPFEGLAPVHVDDLNDAVLVGLALEDDARALLMATGGMNPGQDPPNWDRMPERIKAVYVAGARALRRRYLPWTLDDWKPTRETINALPQPLRGYIMDLETICDPAGEVLEHHQVRQQAAGVEAMYLAEKTDAARWRALLAAAPRLIGAAGILYGERDGEKVVLIDGEHGGYVHAGFEFWTRAGPEWITRGKNGDAAGVLTVIADQVIAQGGEAWAMVNGERVVTPGSGDERDTAGDSPPAPAGG